MGMNKFKVLYISNIEVPYRTKFFNLLGERCDLTVLYEREQSSNRDATWAKSEKSMYKKEFLSGINHGREKAFSFKILKYVLGDYDRIIIGCFNNPVQMLAILAMRIVRKDYYVNIDGKMFDTGNTVKRMLRRFSVRGAKGYFCAGERVSKYLRDFVGDNKPIYSYLLSSMDEKELLEIDRISPVVRNNKILVIGQYEDYKGLDVAAGAAAKTPSYEYSFVGMGQKAERFTEFISKENIQNVEVVPFLQKDDLAQLYRTYGILMLPSRQECWGLVINEAAAYGMPIVSTWGSGAAEEFLSPKYDEYLAKPEDADDLAKRLEKLMKASEQEKEEYSKYLYNKSKAYNIEENVNSFLKGLEA